LTFSVGCRLFVVEGVAKNRLELRVAKPSKLEIRAHFGAIEKKLWIATGIGRGLWQRSFVGSISWQS